MSFLLDLSKCHLNFVHSIKLHACSNLTITRVMVAVAVTAVKTLRRYQSSWREYLHVDDEINYPPCSTPQNELQSWGQLHSIRGGLCGSTEYRADASLPAEIVYARTYSSGEVCGEF